MAVEDPDVGIRQWVARNAQDLNFESLESPGKPLGEGYDADGWPKSSERELTRKLRHDSDAFVRPVCMRTPTLSAPSGRPYSTALHTLNG